MTHKRGGSRAPPEPDRGRGGPLAGQPGVGAVNLSESKTGPDQRGPLAAPREGRLTFLGQGHSVVLQEDHFEPVAHNRIVVDNVADGRDQLDDHLGHVVAGRCLERGRGAQQTPCAQVQGRVAGPGLDTPSLDTPSRVALPAGDGGLRPWHPCVSCPQPGRRTHGARRPTRFVFNRAPLMTAPHPRAQTCQPQAWFSDSSWFFQKWRERGNKDL